MRQLCCAIAEVCREHGRVEGVAPLAAALGQDYRDAQRRICALEARQIIETVRRGRGRRTLIYVF
ncbi:MAG: hypothetical protein NZM11_00750 [Anaerolineales bacterium]|nr:hypothetical protein [Anaerolineales bacterium]